MLGPWGGCGQMNNVILISVDGGCSGKRAACAAVLSVSRRIVAEKSRTVPAARGYALAAEIAGVALAVELIERIRAEEMPVVIEVDNPLVPRVLRGDYRPPGLHLIPRRVLEQARSLCWHPHLQIRVLPRNSTAGLRHAHRLASRRLWAKRRSARGAR